MSTKEKIRLLIYSLSHAAVDMCCAFLVFSFLYGGERTVLILLIYNFCAAVAGMGNALFHIGGGVDVMNLSRGKCAPLGYFVAPGAAGLYFGVLAGKGGFPILPFILIPVICAAAILIFCRLPDMKFKSGNAPLCLKGDANAFGIFGLISLFTVTMLRSYMGMDFDFSWKSIAFWGVIFIVAVVGGKAAGGFLADYIGVAETVALSLGICTLFFYFADIPLMGGLSVLLFNMTMPITLWGVSKMFPGAKGFAFGLLTFALFLGFLPYCIGLTSFINTKLWYSGISLLSFILMLTGLGRLLKRETR